MGSKNNKGNYSDNNDSERGFEDVFSDSSNPAPVYERGRKPLEQREIVYPNKLFEFLGKNNKRNTKRLLIGIIVFLVMFIVLVIASFINDKLNLIDISDGGGFTGNENFSDESYDDAEFDALHDVSDAASLDDLLKKWHDQAGDKMSQKYVINVLLIGIDGKNGVQNGGNSDSLILVSINKKTETITLVSFMRDSRTYFQVNGNDYWNKVNATYARGGAATTVKTLENDYKIEIDYYVAVDFTTFPKLVDALGGVTVDIQEYEQRYINRTTTAIEKIPTYGEVKLNGAQTLVYSRIRHSDADSDVSRTRRQRTVIAALIKSAKGASIGQLNNAVDTLFPYLSTDCPKSKILTYAAQALSQGWMDFEITQLTMPDEDSRADAKINGLSLWVVDYPLAAQKVQTAIYGTTNIELSQNRISALDYVKYNTGYSSGGSSSDETYASTTQAQTDASGGEETTTRRNILDYFTRPTEAEQPPEEEQPVEEQPPEEEVVQTTNSLAGLLGITTAADAE